MKYSVVIPMYNSEKTIARALTSVFSQSRVDLIDEVIIVDDGSVDDSAKIVREIRKEHPIIRLLRKQNGGAASARNIGIKAARNNYVALLDADDEWTLDKIRIQDSILENNYNIHAIGSNRIGESITHGKKVSEGIYVINPFQYCVKNWPCTPSLIFDRRLFKNKKCFPEDMTHAEEGLFFLKLANMNELYYCSENLVLCGGGKRAFGEKGLSGNVGKMHKGVLEMTKRAWHRRYINTIQYIFLILFEKMKYLRRLFIVYRTKY